MCRGGNGGASAGSGGERWRLVVLVVGSGGGSGGGSRGGSSGGT